MNAMEMATGLLILPFGRASHHFAERFRGAFYEPIGY